MMPLTFATAGEENIIKKVGGKTDVRSHLENLGFVPGEQIVVVSRIGGNLIVNVKGSRVALSSELAKHITV